MKHLTFFVLSFLLFTPVLAAESGSGSGSGSGKYAAFGWAGKRAEVKAQSRWSLEDWLTQRDRMKWSDLWLSMNSPSPTEFFAYGTYNLVPKSQGLVPTLRWGLGAYMTIFGLEYEHSYVFEREDNYRFHLRIFGYNVQNTNLSLQVGMRQRAGAESFRQAYLGVSTSIYLKKFFGFQALYRYYLTAANTPTLGSPFGHRIEVGPFLDYGPIRVLGNFLAEAENTGTIGARGAYGWNLGVQFFF